MDFEKILDYLKESVACLSQDSTKWGYCSGVCDCAKAFLYEMHKREAITDNELHIAFEKIKQFRNGL